MKDSREYHELTWLLLVLVAMNVTEGIVAGAYTLAAVALFASMARRDIHRWRERRRNR